MLSHSHSHSHSSSGGRCVAQKLGYTPPRPRYHVQEFFVALQNKHQSIMEEEDGLDRVQTCHSRLILYALSAVSYYLVTTDALAMADILRRVTAGSSPDRAAHHKQAYFRLSRKTRLCVARRISPIVGLEDVLLPRHALLHLRASTGCRPMQCSTAVSPWHVPRPLADSQCDQKVHDCTCFPSRHITKPWLCTL